MSGLRSGPGPGNAGKWSQDTARHCWACEWQLGVECACLQRSDCAAGTVRPVGIGVHKISQRPVVPAQAPMGLIHAAQDETPGALLMVAGWMAAFAQATYA